MDRKYLLSIKELKIELEQEGKNSLLIMQALEKLDLHRREKVLQTSYPRKRAEAIGAGLLLQLGMQAHVADECEERCKIQELSIPQVLSKLNTPMEADYFYGEKGKPYFVDIPLYFSISHCEDYVFCVFSNQEVGADIQYEKPIQEAHMVQRFFAPREKTMWENCTDPKAQKKMFYRLWTRKEAYAKLFGNGIADTVGMDMESLDVCYEEYELENNYRIAICKSCPK